MWSTSFPLSAIYNATGESCEENEEDSDDSESSTMQTDGSSSSSSSSTGFSAVSPAVRRRKTNTVKPSSFGGNNRLFCDCLIVCKDGKRRFLAHKHRLADELPFVKMMFCYGDEDSNPSDDVINTVQVEDGSVTVVQSPQSVVGPSTAVEASCCAEASSTMQCVHSEELVMEGSRRLFHQQVSRGQRRPLQEIRLDVDSRLMKKVLEYVYTKQIRSLTFPSWNFSSIVQLVEDLLPLADCWGADGLVKFCSAFLTERLTVENCVNIWRYASVFFCTKLEKDVRRFILRHIDRIAIEGENTDFFRLPGEAVVKLLSDDWLNVKSEKDVWCIITNWVEPILGDIREERLDFLVPLMEMIRFGQIAGDDAFLCSLSQHHLSRRRFGAVSQLLKSVHFNLHRPIRCKMFRARIAHEVLFVFGGWYNGLPTNVIELYDAKADMWISMENCGNELGRAYHGMVVVDGKVLVVGGYDGTDYYNTVRCFDLDSRQWTIAAPMYVPRCYVAVAVLDEKIYAIGGFDGHVRLSSCEVFDRKWNQWTLIASLNHARSDAAVTAFKGRLYVMGGFDGDVVLPTVEVYEPQQNRWFTVASLSVPRSGVMAAVLNQNIYVVGGFSGQHRLSSAERYDPETLKWTPIASMKKARSNYALAELDGCLYAVGGYDGSLVYVLSMSIIPCHSTIAEVERYEAETNSWSNVAPMAVCRSAIKAVPIENPERNKPKPAGESHSGCCHQSISDPVGVRTTNLSNSNTHCSNSLPSFAAAATDV